ncbi:MAG: hypothetical protein VXW32_11825 [Myxococcota bacterium]|nr:hypothetical protein [Myxococcota bacterium]
MQPMQKVMVLILACGGLGCQRTASTASSSSLDWDSVFPSDTPSAAASATAVSSSTSLRQQLQNTGPVPAAPASPAGAVSSTPREIPVGTGLVTDLPEVGWSWAVESGDTLAVARDSNDQVEALFFAVSPSGGQSSVRNSSDGIVDFLQIVDPAIETTVGLETVGFEADAVRLVPGYQVGQFQTLFRAAGSQTLGRGFGFSSTGFGGWKHSGVNDAGVHLKLARNAGSWGSPTTAGPDVEALETLLLPHVPELEDLFELLKAGQMDAGALDVLPSRSSSMLFGYASVGREVVAYFAFVCAEVPVCSRRADGRELLSQLRPGSLSVSNQAPKQEQLGSLSVRSGLFIRPKTAVLSEQEVEGLREEATTAIVEALEEMAAAKVEAQMDPAASVGAPMSGSGGAIDTGIAAPPPSPAAPTP